MDRSKYPPDWPEISRRIRFERAGNRCEACGIPNHVWVHRGPDGWLVCAAQDYDCTNRDVDEADGGYADHPIRVVLTVAHLGLPVEVPFHLHVARTAQADEVINLVGFGMAFNPEGLERDQVVYRRALTEFMGGTSAMTAGFAIALPSGTTSSPPGGSVVPPMAAAPVWIRLTSWSLFSKPFQATRVATEAPPLANVPTAGEVPSATSLAYGATKPTPNAAVVGVTAGVRTGLAPLGGLPWGQREASAADDASFFGFTATGRPTDAGQLSPNASAAAEFINADARTRLAAGISRCRCGEYPTTDDARALGWAEPWASHVVSIPYHLDHDTTNNADSNLMAMCQRCHLRYDAKLHGRNAKATRIRKSGQGVLL